MFWSRGGHGNTVRGCYWMNHVVVDVSRVLRETGKEDRFKGRLEFEPLEKDGERIDFAEAVETDLVIENTGGDLLVEGRVKSVLSVNCSRCLCDFTLPVELRMRELYVAEEPEEEHLRIVDHAIDLGPAIEEGFILELPIAPLCDAGCKGLCPVCGGNLNVARCSHDIEPVDERMAELKKWLEQREGEGE